MTITKLTRDKAIQRLVNNEMERGIAGEAGIYYAGEAGIYYGKQGWERMHEELLIIYWRGWFNEELEITD